MSKFLKVLTAISIVLGLLIAIIEFVIISLVGTTATLFILIFLPIIIFLALLAFSIYYGVKAGIWTLKFFFKVLGILFLATIIAIVVFLILFATIPLFLVGVLFSVI